MCHWGDLCAVCDTPYIVGERTTDSQVSALNKSSQTFFAIADVQCFLFPVDIYSIGGMLRAFADRVTRTPVGERAAADLGRGDRKMMRSDFLSMEN